MRKIAISLLLIAVMLCGVLLCACNTVTEVIVKVAAISLPGANDPGVNNAAEFLAKVAESFNKEFGDRVHVSVIEFSLLGEKEAVSDCFGTDRAADVLMEGLFNSVSYLQTGRVVDLSDVVVPAVRNDIADAYWDICTANNKVHTLPFVEDQNVLAYNVDIFEACGLGEFVDTSTIQNWSPEQWNVVLATLREKMPADAYPMMMYGKNNQGDTHIMTLLRSQGSRFYSTTGNFNLNTNFGVAGLRWLSDGVKSGYFPKSCYNLELLDCTKMFVKQKLAINVANIALIKDHYLNIPLHYADFDLPYDRLNLGYVNFPYTSGGLATTFVSGFSVFDNGNARKVEWAKKFLSYIYQSEQWMDYSSGGMPVSNRVAQKYAADIPYLDLFHENSQYVWDFMGGHSNWSGVREVFAPIIHELLADDISVAQAAQMIDQQCNAALKGR